MTTPLAVDQWYGFAKFYDYDKGTNKYPAGTSKAGKAKVDQEAAYFKGLLWRSYGKVSFGVRAPWVVGRFCPPTGATAVTTRTAVDNVENVNPICVPKTGSYNRCYNKLALKYHNEMRALREGTKNLELDPAIATYIQAEMEKPGFATAGKIASRGPWAECGESTYKQDKTAAPGADAVEFTNEASKAWYAGQSEYDATTGKQTASGDTAKW